MLEWTVYIWDRSLGSLWDTIAGMLSFRAVTYCHLIPRSLFPGCKCENCESAHVMEHLNCSTCADVSLVVSTVCFVKCVGCLLGLISISRCCGKLSSFGPVS